MRQAATRADINFESVDDEEEPVAAVGAVAVSTSLPMAVEGEVLKGKPKRVKEVSKKQLAAEKKRKAEEEEEAELIARKKKRNDEYPAQDDDEEEKAKDPDYVEEEVDEEEEDSGPTTRTVGEIDAKGPPQQRSSSSSDQPQVLAAHQNNDDDDDDDGNTVTKRQMSRWAVPDHVVAHGPLHVNDSATGESENAVLLRELSRVNGIPAGLTRERCMKNLKDGSIMAENSNHTLHNEIKL